MDARTPLSAQDAHEIKQALLRAAPIDPVTMARELVKAFLELDAACVSPSECPRASSEGGST